ncbi:hypothetical protein [Candidatus Solincola sp.]|jgi:hypothetical protein|nr:hypothetical protein [Actinomycetota bacterium]MDI7251522.1 hypothetical protein [Actinomycetota bacterium]
MARGIASGKLRPSSLARMAALAGTAAALRRSYGDYPEHPAFFGPWADKVRRLWGRADGTRHEYFRSLLRGMVSLALRRTSGCGLTFAVIF